MVPPPPVCHHDVHGDEPNIKLVHNYYTWVYETTISYFNSIHKQTGCDLVFRLAILYNESMVFQIIIQNG